MASGTPVVTSNVSSLPEVTGDAAVLVDPTTPRRSCEGVRRVLSDPAFADQLRRKGPVRARSSRGSDRWPRRGTSTSAWPRAWKRSRRRREGGAGPRLADRHARGREGPRSAVPAVSAGRHLHARPPRGARSRRRSSRAASRRRSCSSCQAPPRATAATCRCSRTAIEQLDLDGYDLVISSSHCVAKSVVVPGRAWHICPTASRRCATPGTSSTSTSARRAWARGEPLALPAAAGPAGPLGRGHRRARPPLRG